MLRRRRSLQLSQPVVVLFGLLRKPRLPQSKSPSPEGEELTQELTAAIHGLEWADGTLFLVLELVREFYASHSNEATLRRHLAAATLRRHLAAAIAIRDRIDKERRLADLLTENAKT